MPTNNPREKKNKETNSGEQGMTSKTAKWKTIASQSRGTKFGAGLADASALSVAPKNFLAQAWPGMINKVREGFHTGRLQTLYPSSILALF